MPKPAKVLIRDVDRWPIPHRQVQPEEIVALAKNLIQYSGKKHRGIKRKLLDFRGFPSEKKAQQAWSAIWGNLVHLLGLGYTSNRDPIIRATPLASLLAANPPKWQEYYVRLAMSFQFPYAELKHTGYKKQSIAVQPFALIVQYLVELADRASSETTGDFSKVYLSYEEIAAVLMTSHSHDPVRVRNGVNAILANRASGHDYNANAPSGFELAKDDFHRLKFILEKPLVISFNDNQKRVYLADGTALSRARAVLVAFHPPFVITKDNQASERIDFFSRAFVLSRPLPSFVDMEEFADQILDADLPTRPIRRQGFRPYRRRKTRTITRAKLLETQEEQAARGHEGEVLVNQLLQNAHASGVVIDFKWMTEEDKANAPYDFELSLAGGQKVLLEVKTTNGNHENVFNMSYAELVECAYLDSTTASAYRILRVSEIGNIPVLKLSAPLSPLMRPVADYLAGLDEIDPMVRASGIRIKPESIEWDANWLVAISQ